MPQFLNLDAQQNLFFARQLEFVKTSSYDVKYPNLKARSLIPVSFATPEGAKTITWRSYNQFGFAKVVANYATDFPKVTIAGEENTSHIKRLGDSYSYTVDDIAAAQMAGMNLDTRLAAAAKRAIMQKENSIAFFGDTATNLPGFLSNANIPTAAVAADGVGASTLWSTKDANQIIRDVNAMINGIKTNTLGVEMPNTVVLPVSRMATIASTPRSDNSDTTILEFLKRVHPYITSWDELNELETAGPGGEAQMIAYDKSPMALEMEVPLDFTQYPAQDEGLEFNIPCSSKTGGTIVYYPLSANFAYGI